MSCSLLHLLYVYVEGRAILSVKRNNENTIVKGFWMENTQVIIQVVAYASTSSLQNNYFNTAKSNTILPLHQKLT